VDGRVAFVRHEARKYLWRTETVQKAYAAHPGPKLLMRYEELLADPVRHMREVLDWLGAPLPERQLAEMVESRSFERVADRGPSRFFRSASPGKWRENLSAEEQEAMLEVLGPKLAELGYE
jgi:hypothetical protein